MDRGALWRLAWLALVASAFGCGGVVPDGNAPVVGPPQPSTTSIASVVATATSTSPSPPPGPTTVVEPAPPVSAAIRDPSAPHEGPLAAFHDALRDLAAGTRREHVRVAWLGDSHAQADFWTGYLREALQERFGDGGPGFVHVGLKGYRHGGMRIDVHGKWRMRPKAPSTSAPFGDGAFGLGGVLTAGYGDSPWGSVELADHALEGKLVHWDLCYKWGDAAGAFTLETGPVGGPAVKRKLRADGPIGELQHLTFESQGLASLRVLVEDIKVEMCGVVIETDPLRAPGVVVDTLGINGARYATALAWNAARWAAELRRRSPELVVVEYGGNEAGDRPSRVADYKRHLLTLVARVRAILPKTSCLVVGLTERVDAEERIAPIRDAQRDAAAEAGCMFWDSYEKMGGPGAMRAWVADKRAADDGIHLTPRGYKEIATLLVDDLLADYHGR